MKDTTIVNGVTLTRSQVEAALKDLNQPEEYIPAPGDVFIVTGSFGYNGVKFLALSPTTWRYGFVMAAKIGNGEAMDFSLKYYKFAKAIL